MCIYHSYKHIVHVTNLYKKLLHPMTDMYTCTYVYIPSSYGMTKTSRTTSIQFHHLYLKFGPQTCPKQEGKHECFIYFYYIIFSPLFLLVCFQGTKRSPPACNIACMSCMIIPYACCSKPCIYNS